MGKKNSLEFQSCHLEPEKTQPKQFTKYWSNGILLTTILSFGTTSVNTGHLNGTCTPLEDKIGRDLLWLVRCHRTLELILAKVFTLCFGLLTLQKFLHSKDSSKSGTE
ncbi:hypothetical protein AVEN_155680-1 [Araneus ventricosus]|uniref:Uncharacterized protein n=1 Tax=Araneus ventricosus TaxID=182803 RepID=A0A4Y2LVY9_ARAVE|nr:hypothetical protein AVEN_12084-1 [Araneus ventricosus]GBN18574.1 hypothetical protein AVEN_155680-1 [Araneus ventricosus]